MVQVTLYSRVQFSGTEALKGHGKGKCNGEYKSFASKCNVLKHILVTPYNKVSLFNISKLLYLKMYLLNNQFSETIGCTLF